GRGFYAWKKGQPVREGKPDDNADLGALAERLLKPFLDECVACRDEQIVADDELLDAGIIFGTGFAPFRGGPLHYLESRSAKPAGEKTS
ncbi:MAG: 3-hydroxyacyl-CoA dehydrogenase, partial [Gammaproteobacteria bacterium]|nr:3-hydroxyacyl-CoA dehydrogenase [Gammaproteobacteria bacterium]